LCIATPLLVIGIRIFDKPGETWYHLLDTVLWDYVNNTLIIFGATGALTLVFGVSTAYLISLFNFPGRKFFSWALILPLSIPTYIMAFTYSGIFGYTGPYSTFLRNKFSGSTAEMLSIDVMNMGGLVILLALALYPYVFISSRVAFSGKFQNYREASSSLGISQFRTFFRIMLPLARPSIFGGLFLVLMEVLNDYGAMKYFGINTFTTGIFTAWFSMNDLSAAIKLAGILMVIVFLMMGIEKWQRRNKKFSESAVENQQKHFTLSGYKKWGATLLCTLIFVAGFALPFSFLVSDSFLTWEVVWNDGFTEMFWNSILMAVLAAAFIIVMGVVIGFSKRINRTLIGQIVSMLARVGYTIPGAVIAVGVIIVFTFLDRQYNILTDTTGLLLTGSIAALLFGYIVRFMAVGYNSIDSAFEKQVKGLDEASMSLGKSPLKTLTRVNLPLIRSGIFAGAILVFVDVLKELPLTLILRPFNFYTLATKAFEYADDEMLAKAALPSVCIVLAGIVPIYLLHRLMQKKL
jgi:iron(III) transport system permease protein